MSVIEEPFGVANLAQGGLRCRDEDEAPGDGDALSRRRGWDPANHRPLGRVEEVAFD